MEEWTPGEIFLNDESIANWEHPVPEGSVWMKNPHASTKLLTALWDDSLDKTIWKYRIVAATAKYEAEIRRINLRNTWDHLPTQEEILFTGGITILEDGKIPWTDLTGYDVKRVGRIWTASNDTLMRELGGSLKKLILGHDPDKYCERIEAILRWYEKQEEAEERSRRMERRPVSY